MTQINPKFIRYQEDLFVFRLYLDLMCIIPAFSNLFSVQFGVSSDFDFCPDLISHGMGLRFIGADSFAPANP